MCDFTYFFSKDIDLLQQNMQLNHDDDDEEENDNDDVDGDDDDDDLDGDDGNDQMTYLLSVTVSFVST